MNTPNDRHYAKTHEWVREINGVLEIGITDHAQAQLGDLMFVGDVKVGAHLEAGAPAGVVESLKTASDIHAPVSGTVVAFNEALAATPEQVNETPYETWIFRLQPDTVFDAAALLDAAGYLSAVDD